MICFVRFFNNTASPVISVISDDRKIFSDILQDTFSPYTTLTVGRREITILQNNDKIYIKTYISLPLYGYITVLVQDAGISVINDVKPHSKSYKNPF